jgi:nucleoside-diphosphate-sugar epimerase
MRVAVTGARGYVGGAVVRALLERGHTVAALVRGPAPGLDVRVRPVTGDVRDVKAIEDLVRGADAVAHTAAWVHKSADHATARAECFSVNVDGTRTVIDALAAQGRGHLVYVSSIAVYGGPIEGATESAALHPTTAYGRSKLEAEHLVLAAAAAGRITGCVLRPSVVYGAGAPGNTERLLSLVRRAAIPMVRGGENRKSVIHVDDLARVVVAALEKREKVNGGVYNVAGGALSVREMARALAEGARVPLRTMWTPAWPWTAAAWAFHHASRATGGRLPDYGRTLEVFSENATVDASKVERDLAVSFRDPYRGLVESVKSPN